jgi:hypothetical protein
MAWVQAFAGYEQRFRGHHGGRTREEVDTWAGLLPL